MAQPLSFRMSATAAEKLIRQRAEASERVIFTDHAQERMNERGFTIDDVLTIVRKGGVYLSPFKNDRGDWQVDVERRMPGGREAVAITIVPQDELLIVRTVMWRDER